MTNILSPATPEDLQNHDDYEGDDPIYISVHRRSDDSYRHGSYVTEVFHRAEDNTYWQASYTNCPNYNELYEGKAIVSQVYPYDKVVTIRKYTANKEEAEAA